MPALNAAPTLARHVGRSRATASTTSSSWTTGRATPPSSWRGRYDIDLIWHPTRVGYGGNQKTCYLEALQRGADVVVMLHPDGQYDPALIPKLCEPILTGEADLVLGSRLLEPGPRARAGCPSTSASRTASSRASRTASWARSSRRRTRATARTRAGSCSPSRSCATRIDFAFDSELLMQAVHFGFPIAEVPGAYALLQRGVVGRAAGGRGLRGEDALGRRPADPAPGGIVRSRKFTAERDSSTTVKPPSSAATG